MKLQILQVLLRSLNSFILSISRKIETNLDQLKTREDTTLLTQTVEATKADPKKVGGTIDKSLSLTLKDRGRRPAKKTIFSRLLIGLKKGYNTPTLPENILKFQSLIYIRILRVLGGISFLFILSKHYLNYHIYFLYISMFIATLFTIYHIIISYHRIKHMKKVLRSGHLDC